MVNAKSKDMEIRMHRFSEKIGDPKYILSCTSEKLTREKLIDHFLYDILNYSLKSKHLFSELETMEQRRVDYAIMKNNRPLIFVEAKRRGVALEQNHLFSQTIGYGNEVECVQFVVLTNGIEYYWFKKTNTEFDRKPFLIHDVIVPTNTEIPFLNAIQKKNMNISRALKIANSFDLIDRYKEIFANKKRKKYKMSVPTNGSKFEFRKDVDSCAWKPISSDDWIWVHSAGDLLAGVLKYLAKLNEEGPNEFFSRAEIYLGNRIRNKKTTKKFKQKNQTNWVPHWAPKYIELNSKYVVDTNVGNGNFDLVCAYLCRAESLVIYKERTFSSDDLVDILIPMKKIRKRK